MSPDPMQMDTPQRGVEGIGARATELVGEARGAVDEVAERTRRTVEQVSESAADVADRFGTQANDALDRALRYTSAHPLQALGVVLIAGILVGRLSRR